MPPLPPQMIVATTGSSDTSIVESVAGTSLTSSWKLPWEARRETRELLTGVGYDTLAMGRFFEIRPERAFLRVAQVPVLQKKMLFTRVEVPCLCWAARCAVVAGSAYGL